jgi:hypothetical protein
MSVSLPSWCRIVRDKNAEAISAFRRRQPVVGPKSAAAMLGARLCGEEVEVVAVLLLDAQARVIALQGGHPGDREFFAGAPRARCSASRSRWAPRRSWWRTTTRLAS